MKQNITILFFVSMIISCNHPKELTQAEMKNIVSTNNAKLEKCFLSSDSIQLKEVYADDARLCPNNDTYYVGKEEIYNFWKEDLKTGKVNKMETNTLSVNGNIDVIYETGITHVETTINDSLYKSAVKFINVWTRQSDGSYKLSIDFWNKYIPEK
jgi:ketosteroid isomerase-like protein